MKSSLRRSLGAMVTACAVLVAMATPASATAITVGLTGGSIVIAKTGLPTQSYSITPGTCPTGTLAADISSTSSGTLSVTGFSRTSEFLWNGATYVTVLTLGTAGAATGTYDHATGVMTGLKVPLRAQIYTKANACTAGTLLCTWTTLLTLSSSNFTAHTVSSTATLPGTGTNLALGGACAAPFTTYTGGSVTVTFQVHVTS